VEKWISVLPTSSSLLLLMLLLLMLDGKGKSHVIIFKNNFEFIHQPCLDFVFLSIVALLACFKDSHSKQHSTSHNEQKGKRIFHAIFTNFFFPLTLNAMTLIYLPYLARTNLFLFLTHSSISSSMPLSPEGLSAFSTFYFQLVFLMLNCISFCWLLAFLC